MWALFGFAFLLGFNLTTYVINGRLRREVNRMFYHDEDAFHYSPTVITPVKVARIKRLDAPKVEQNATLSEDSNIPTLEATDEQIAEFLRKNPVYFRKAIGGNHVE